MKKQVLRGLSLLLVLMFTLPALAVGSLDLSYIKGSNSLFTLDVDNEQNCAFITTKMTSDMRAFHHKYESDYYYSTTQFDTLICEYYKSSAYPVFRLWISYAADNDLNIDSVSFILDGKMYTFSDCADTEWFHKTDNCRLQDVMIKFGTDNADFLMTLVNMLQSLGNIENVDQLDKLGGQMILHGSMEDITVYLTNSFWLDAYAMILAFTNIDGFSYFDQSIATPMKVSTVY